jgi:hypothetical protein
MYKGREALSRRIQLTLSESDKAALERMSYEQGATMRGFIRKLIRDAASRQIPEREHLHGAREVNHATR